MAIYAIHVYEQMFGGSYGIQEQFVIVCQTYEEAKEEANDAFYELFNTYSNIFESELADMGDDEIDDFYQDQDQDHMVSAIYQIREDCPLSPTELNEMARCNFDKLITKWGTLIVEEE